jgi:hypothetical protein
VGGDPEHTADVAHAAGISAGAGVWPGAHSLPAPPRPAPPWALMHLLISLRATAARAPAGVEIWIIGAVVMPCHSGLPAREYCMLRAAVITEPRGGAGLHGTY